VAKKPVAAVRVHPREKVFALARAQCPPEEIAAILAAEYGGDVRTISEFLVNDPLKTQLSTARIAGQGYLRVHMYEVATTGSSQQSVTLGTWLARQHLGQSTGGTNTKLQKAIKAIESMSPEEQIAHLRSMVKQLMPGADDGDEVSP
jgi:hypothetical protein